MNTEIKLDKNGLPSIEALLQTRNPQHRYRFVRPNLGGEVIDAHPEKLPGGSTAHILLPVRRLTLFGQCAAPFHRQPKEKIYVLLCGIFTVYLLIEGQLYAVSLTPKQPTITVPSAVPHALFTHDNDLGDGTLSEHSLIVVSSSADPTTFWEEGIDDLLMNRHLAPPVTMSLAYAAAGVQRIG